MFPKVPVDKGRGAPSASVKRILREPLNHAGKKNLKSLREGAAGPASSGFDRVRGPAAPIPLAAQAAHREARQGLLQKALSHALGGPSPKRLGGAGSRARQPPRPLSASRRVGRWAPGAAARQALSRRALARSPGPVFVLAARACSRPRATYPAGARMHYRGWRATPGGGPGRGLREGLAAAAGRS